MNSCPPPFPSLLGPNGLQGGEYDISTPLFYQDSIPSHPNMVFGTLDFSHHVPSARPSVDHNPWQRIEGLQRKFLHREIEKERRRDMKSRYSALRSLLPQGNIKGKASTDRTLSEAADYLRHLQEEIDQLSKKRDEMKMKTQQRKSHKQDKLNIPVLCHESETFPLVHICHVGSFVIITTNTSSDDMPLSNLLHAIEEEGLQIHSAASLVTDNKVFHTVHCKVFGMQSFNGGDKLHAKLWQLIGKNRIPDAYPPVVEGYNKS